MDTKEDEEIIHNISYSDQKNEIKDEIYHNGLKSNNISDKKEIFEKRNGDEIKKTDDKNEHLDNSNNLSRISYKSVKSFGSNEEHPIEDKNEFCERVDNEYCNYEFKIILIGSINVGKTCILKTFTEKQDNRLTIQPHQSLYSFKNKTVGTCDVSKISNTKFEFEGRRSDAFNNGVTLGFQTEFKSIVIDEHSVVGLTIWDTSGEERFKTVTRQYYRDCDGVILVYDVTNKASFISLTTWLSEINDYGPKDVNIVIAGNKIDLKSQRQISFDEANEFCKKNGIDYIEISAIQSINIDLLFVLLSSQIIQAKESEMEEFENDENNTNNVNKNQLKNINTGEKQISMKKDRNEILKIVNADKSLMIVGDKKTLKNGSTKKDKCPC